MEQKTFKEEYLEVLWYMKEDGNTSLAYFKDELGANFKQEVLEEIAAEGIVHTEDDRISLTEKGNNYTRQLIRSHRLAERLVHDVLGVEFEKGACEFEHILNPDLVDSICTLLGHPRECPHGMPIPEGECCRQRAQMVESSVMPLDQLEVGESARIAYVYGSSDQQIHKLDNLLVRPGSRVKLHQRQPSFVIECEDAMIAIDERVAADIHVWASSERNRLLRPHGRRRTRRGFRHGLGSSNR
ncbi:MAG: metal-dependent transcriptional regulator [Spirochaetaceae bacterium]|nr:MAG: metal-dependent transcriptional regulator [Spirochaetaceae bacterium]